MTRREKVVLKLESAPTGTILSPEFGHEAYIGVRLWLASHLFTSRSVLTTAMAGSNNDLVYTTLSPGALGPAIQVRHRLVAGNNMPLNIWVSNGNQVGVDLATDETGAIKSTANDVMALVNSDPLGSKLVRVTLAPGNDGTGIVAAFGFTNITGGADGGSATMKLEIKNPASGVWVDFPGAAFAALAGGAGNQMLTIFPGLTPVANSAVSQVLSGGLRINAVLASGFMNATVTAQFIGE